VVRAFGAIIARRGLRMSQDISFCRCLHIASLVLEVSALLRSAPKGGRVPNWPFVLLIGAAMVAGQGCHSEPVAVSACVETEPVGSPPDAADDAAIWLNRAAPGESLVIATDKKAGLHVYDLTGRELQFLPIGRTNNVDLRLDFPFPEAAAPIIAVSNRTDHSVTLLRFDEGARRIEPKPAAVIPTKFKEKLQGVCLYRGEADEFQVAASDKSGEFHQWRLKLQADGSIATETVRNLSFSSTAEGCAFDDELSRLYVGEEEVALWRLPADPEKGDNKNRVDSASPPEGFSPDIEGVAIYKHDNGTGYVIASIQGDSTFRVYRREADNAYVGSFRVVGCPDGMVDEVTTTDGIEATSKPLGSDWPAGLLVVQDNAKTDLPSNQNFKFVRWDQIEQKLGIGRSRPWWYFSLNQHSVW
jgi:3-phytase